MCGEKKGFFSKFFEKIDKKMKEKADQPSCGCCCSSQPQAQADDQGEEKKGCC